MSKLSGGRAPKSPTRLGLELALHHTQERSRLLHHFLYAFGAFFGRKRSKKRLKQMKAAYNALYPKCSLHEQGKYCEYPWVDVGWVVNKIDVKR